MCIYYPLHFICEDLRFKSVGSETLLKIKGRLNYEPINSSPIGSGANNLSSI